MQVYPRGSGATWPPHHWHHRHRGGIFTRISPCLLVHGSYVLIFPLNNLTNRSTKLNENHQCVYENAMVWSKSMKDGYEEHWTSWDGMSRCYDFRVSLLSRRVRAYVPLMLFFSCNFNLMTMVHITRMICFSVEKSYSNQLSRVSSSCEHGNVKFRVSFG